MKNSMETFRLRLLMSIIQFALITLSNCRKEEVVLPIVPSLANFAVNSGTIGESEASGIVVQIQLSAPARSEGSITVTLEQGQAVYGANFTTSPAAINNSITFNVAQNESSTSFKILPIDNSTCFNRTVSFTISSGSGVVKAGRNVKYYLTIKGDAANGAAMASFAESTGTVDENNASGIVVSLSFSKPAKGAGSIYIYPSEEYGSKFVTSPEALYDYSDGYYVNLNVAKGATSLSFTVLPINNLYKNSNYSVVFSLGGGSNAGCFQVAPNAKYTLTIMDDD